MKAGTMFRIFALAAGFAFATSSVALAGPSFGEFASGVKSLTESAKDVSSINQENKQNKQNNQVKTPTQKQNKPQNTKRSPRQQEQVQGG